MTEQQKLAAAERRAARRAMQEARYAEEKADKAIVLTALRAVLRDPECNSAQRLYAVAILDRMQNYYFVPHDAKFPAGPDRDGELIDDFAKKLKEREAANAQ